MIHLRSGEELPWEMFSGKLENQVLTKTNWTVMLVSVDTVHSNIVFFCLSLTCKSPFAATLFILSGTRVLGQQHSSMSSSPELYSFLLIALKLVLSFRLLWCFVGTWGEVLPLKSFWTFGHNPLASSLSTRVTWNVGTKVGSTAIWSTAQRQPWSTLSTQRSIRAPLRPQGSLEARCSNSWLMFWSRRSGKMILEQPRLEDASWRLRVMCCATSAARVSSRGKHRKLLSNSIRDMSATEPKANKIIKLKRFKSCVLYSWQYELNQTQKCSFSRIKTHQFGCCCLDDQLWFCDCSPSARSASAAGCPRTAGWSACLPLEMEESCRPRTGCKKKTSL